MSQICILGIKGAGKTVFISVLANRYREIRSGKPYMEFENSQTNPYVSAVWDTLTKERRWPDSTSPGSFESLEWVLHAQDGQTHGLKVLDAPGQDVQAIFSGQETLSSAQEKLAASIDAADCVVFLVNLCEIISATSAKERADYESPIVLAIKSLLRRNARVAILISQHDRLKRSIGGGLIIRSGGKKTLESESLGMSAIDAVKSWLPAAYEVLKNATEDESSGIYVGFVSAVADTEARADGNGDIRSFPKENFESYGLDEALAWMTESLSSRKAEKLREWRKDRLRVCLGGVLLGGILLSSVIVGVRHVVVGCKEANFKEEAEAPFRRKYYEHLGFIRESQEKAKKKYEGNKVARDEKIEKSQKSEEEELSKCDKEYEEKLKKQQSDYGKRSSEYEANLAKLLNEKEKAKDLLKEVYRWQNFGILDESASSPEWTWKIASGWGKDDVEISILCRENWRMGVIKIFPKDKKSLPFGLNLDPTKGNFFKFEDLHNFHNKGAGATLDLYIRDAKQEEENTKQHGILMAEIESKEIEIHKKMEECKREYEGAKSDLATKRDSRKAEISAEHKKVRDGAENTFKSQEKMFQAENQKLIGEGNSARECLNRKIEEVDLEWSTKGEEPSGNFLRVLFFSLCGWVLVGLIAILGIFRKKEISC